VAETSPNVLCDRSSGARSYVQNVALLPCKVPQVSQCTTPLVARMCETSIRIDSGDCKGVACSVRARATNTKTERIQSRCNKPKTDRNKSTCNITNPRTEPKQFHMKWQSERTRKQVTDIEGRARSPARR
jgi:hypothetical protein